MTGGPLVADCCFVISPTAGDWGLISATILPGNSWWQWFRILISSFGCHRPSGVAMWWAADHSTPLEAMEILANTFTLLHSVNKLKKTVYSWLFVWVGYDDLHTNRGRLKRKKWSKCLKFDWISNRLIPFDSSWKTLHISFWTQADQTKNVAAKSRKQHLSTCAPPCARIFSGRFTAERLFRSNWSQKKSVRASSKLSIGMNRNFIRIFLTLEKEKWIFR